MSQDLKFITREGTNYFPEAESFLPPIKMKVCGQAFEATEELVNNFNGRPISAAFVEFINVGQTLVWLNSSIPIRPAGGYYSVKNPCFNAKWIFYPIADPPDTDSKYIQAGNKLIVIVHYNHDSQATLRAPADAAGGGAGGAVSLLLTDINLTPGGATTDVDFTIPAGKIFVDIKNVGGLAPAIIQVNGIDVPPGEFIRRQQWFDGINRYILPEFEVVTNGSMVKYYIETNPLI